MSDQHERLLEDSNKSEEDTKDYGSNTQSSETSVDLRISNFNNKHQPNAILKKHSVYARKSKPPTTSVHDLMRSSTLSFFVLIGYAINFVSVASKSVTNSKQHAPTWRIIYVSSLGWLFFSCLLIMFMSLCNCAMTTTRRKILLITLFLFGFIGYTTSLILGLFFEDNHGHICWEFELLYALLPLYMIVLISFFGQSNKRSSCINMIKLVIFSFILCATPLVRLIQIGKFPELSLPLSQKPAFAYSAVCVATFLVISTHSICYMRHINSGLFFKFVIVCGLLMCSIVICMRQKIDFDKYSDRVRIYYYYVLLIALYVMYLCELLIEPPPKIIKSDMLEHLQNRKSFAGIEMLNVPAFGKETSIQNGIFSVSKSVTGVSVNNLPFQSYSNPNEKIKSVIKIFADKFPCQQNANKYFDEIPKPNREDCVYEQERLTDSITVIVPFYNEQAREVHATLRSLYLNFSYIRQEDNKYEFTHFNVLLVGDGWFKAHTSTKQYLAKLYNCAEIDDNFKTIVEQQQEHNTVILQTQGNKPLCINPFDNGEDNMMMKISTIIKIDNRKKANSHQWFLGKYGFAEWCDCDFMYFTDAYSTLNPKGLYQMLVHMDEPKNKDVICCTGRARIYSFEDEYNFKKLYGTAHRKSLINVEQKHEENEEECKIQNEGKWWENKIFFEKDDLKKQDIMENDYSSNIIYNLDIEDTDSDHRLSINAHVRQCQMFEFEALYGTIGCYLLGGFLPVIPGPCGFYRGKNYLLEDEVRNWYFDQINKENDPENINLLLGNMKLAEDRILTITSILNYNGSVRHSLIPECVFYFDPMPDLISLMKQRRRWINGSIATIIYVLRKVPFTRWKVSILRRWYVLSTWYMQLIMYTVLFLSPPILFIISFQYGLASILSEILVDHKDGKQQKTIDSTVTLFMIIAWLIYIAFIYAAQRKEAKNDRKFKQKIVKLMLFMSYTFGVLTMIGLAMQFVDLIKVIINPTKKNIMGKSFEFFVLVVGVIFFMQSFVLAPLFSKDITTLIILLKTFLSYFFYAPFYVILFFVNAICNVHDLSWGTRPDNPIEETGNPKHTTYKIIAWLLIINIITAIIMQPFTEGIYSRVIIFILLSLPSLFQIFFALLWLIPMRFMDVLRVSLPKRVRDVYDYQIENYQ